MININLRRNHKHIFLGVLVLFLILTASCEKTKSYSELLRAEERAVNWYLSSQKVILDLPENPKDFITCATAGDEAPFYRLDSEGYVYMQIVSADYDDIVEEGDLVYFRYSRLNISYLYEGIEHSPGGNSDYLINGPASFVYKNTSLSSTTTWGNGIQMPLSYVGYNSEVNLVLKSTYGFSEEQSSCIPYLINLRYFKPEY